VSALDQIAQVVNAWWLVLDQDQKQVEGERGEGLGVASRVNRTHVWDTLANETRG